MPKRTLVESVATFERKVELLESLPARMTAIESRVASVESQLLQLRDEMHGEFSAVRAELRAEIRAGDEETRRCMRVLHEGVLSRIALISEGRR